MPQKDKKTEKRALAPADSSRAYTYTRTRGGEQRRAKRTAQMTAAPRIMRRPKPRRRPQQVTAQFGAITPNRRKRKVGVSPFSKKKKAVQTVKVKGGRLPWVAIFTALCCTAVISAMVINYVRLNELTNDYRAAQDEVAELIADKKRLEQPVDVKEYQEQAEKYGMVGSDRVQKKYIKLQSEDKIVVHEDEGNAFTRFFAGIWQSICSFFGNIFGGK